MRTCRGWLQSGAGQHGLKLRREVGRQARLRQQQARPGLVGPGTTPKRLLSCMSGSTSQHSTAQHSTGQVHSVDAQGRQVARRVT